jgi:hypothetical protein
MNKRFFNFLQAVSDDDQVKRNEMVRDCSTRGVEVRADFVGNFKETGHMETGSR